jgi:transposase-like protein
MARLPVEIVLDNEEEAELERLRRRRKTTAGLHVRAGIILDCARGYSGEEIAERHHTSQQTVSKWRRRFARDCLAERLMRHAATNHANTTMTGCRPYWKQP